MISQLAIAIFGVTSVFLSQHSSPVFQRFACVFGLLGQPFWIYATYSTEQWGMFYLTLLYTWAWGRGFVRYWVKPYYGFRSD